MRRGCTYDAVQSGFGQENHFKPSYLGDVAFVEQVAQSGPATTVNAWLRESAKPNF